MAANSTADNAGRTVMLTSPKILVISMIAWTLTNMDQAFFAYALPGILAEFDLPLEAAGAILTISFVVSAVLMLFAGAAADKYGRGPMLCLLLALSALLVGLQGMAGGIVMLTLFRAFGFGFSAGLSPITNTYVVENVSARMRGIAMGVLQCGYPLGWALAALFAVPLLEHYSWRELCFAAFLVIPVTGLFWWMLRDTDERPAPKADTPAAPPASSTASSTATMRQLFTPQNRRNSIASMVTHFAFGGAYAGSAFFFPTYFAEVRGYSASEAASLVGWSNFIAIGGYLAAALIGEFLISRRKVFLIWTSGGALALLALLWLPETRFEDTLYYALTAALFYGSLAVLPVLIAELFDHNIRATALAVCASAPLTLGFAVFPLIVPFVVSAIGWQAALSLVVCPLIAVAIVAAFFLPDRKSGIELDAPRG